MDNGLGRIAGVAAFVLMMMRLGRLLESGPEAPSWQLIMIASAFLGGVVWWLLGQTITSRRLAWAVFVVAGSLLFLRIAVPATLALGFLPTLETFPAVASEFAQALDLIRFGVAPVFPTPGIVAVLALLMWATGALFVWGANTGPTLAMFAPSIGLYLQFAVMDRIPAGLGWMGAAAVVIALSLAALGLDRRRDSGRVRNLEGRPLSRKAGGMAIALAVFVGAGSLFLTDSASSLVPENGNIRWRVGGGYGPGFGGVTFDRLADLQQSIIRRSNTVMFLATLDPDAPAGNEIYWRMESLSFFDGEAWRPSAGEAEFYEPGIGGGDPDYAYRGTTQDVTQRIQISNLRSQVMPTAGIGRFFRSDSINVNAMQITADGSAIYQALLDEGDEYEVQAVFPLQVEDLGALATLPDGTLSPLFANASEAGATTITPGEPPGDTTLPPDYERFIALPEEVPGGITTTARLQTRGASTPFEAAWLLQYWFRDSGEFEYSTEVSTGHGSLDLEAWLTDESSPNYRVGYCEQFAAAMAVMGRSLGIPSRVVWGFAPGTIEQQGDGTDVVVVRDNNAHAWVEMWMDGFGWVRFDPTPRGDGVLPESLTSGFDPEPFLPPPGEGNTATVDQPGFFLDEEARLERLGETIPQFGDEVPGVGIEWVWVVVGLAVAATLIPLLKSLRRRSRVAKISEGDVAAAWDEIVDRLTDIGAPVPPHQTPLEFARSTDQALVPLAHTYSAAVYGGHDGRGRVSELHRAEDWIKTRYDARDRALAAFNPRSLISRE